MKGKVLFVEPAGAPSNVFAKFMSIPLLGPVQLATMAKRDGFEVAVVNENMVNRAVSETELLKADILCLSCITATINRGKEIASRYRKLRGNGLKSRVLIGGIHASMLPQDPGPDFDQVICGEAESVFLSILNGKITDSLVHGSQLKNLDEASIPDFSLVKNSHKMRIWPVMTSRGCPFDCNFCSVTKMFGKTYRTQSTERVIEEISRYNNGWIFFVDDNFAAIPKRTHELLDEMLRYNLKRPWTAQVRVDAARDPEMIRKMRAAGCGIVYIGLESINPGSLQKMQKHQGLSDIQKAIKTFKSNGIQVHGMFMLGNDPDTKDIFKATSIFCKKSRLNYVQYSVLTPLPGTETYQELEEQGRLLHKNWSLYDGLHVVFKPLQMTPAELQHGMIDCFKSFYSYTNAARDALRTTINIVRQFGQKFLPRFSFHSFFPAIMKISGKTIVKKWVSCNKAYLSYLKSLRG